MIVEDSRRIALSLPLGNKIAALHPDDGFGLVEDPRSTSRAAIIGMMVLRPAARRWSPRLDAAGFARDMGEIHDWCFDVAGVGGSWPISASNPFDAYRLALQYGTVDAVMAGSSTIVREGIEHDAHRAHLWQPYTPLSWPVLRAQRSTLEPAIARIRSRWQELGVLSARRYPAQIAITQSGQASRSDVAGGSAGDVLDARIFDARHPDGSPVEAYLLTSAAGAERLRQRAMKRGRSIDSMLIIASAPDDPERIDVARVPGLIRSALDARLVQHDGGATSLMAFVEAGAVCQLNFSLMRRRSVRDVLAASDRLDTTRRDEVLDEWPRAARLFPPLGGPLPGALGHALAEEGPDGEAVAVTLDVRTQA